MKYFIVIFIAMVIHIIYILDVISVRCLNLNIIILDIWYMYIITNTKFLLSMCAFFFVQFCYIPILLSNELKTFNILHFLNDKLFLILYSYIRWNWINSKLLFSFLFFYTHSYKELDNVHKESYTYKITYYIYNINY